MSSKMADMDSQKVTVTFPQAVLDRLKEVVPLRQRSAFIVAAVAEKLALEEQATAIEEAAGSWPDAAHPALTTDEDIERWLAELRQAWRAGGPGEVSPG